MRLREAWVSSRQRLESAGIPDASLESEVLLRHTLGTDRATFFASLDRKLSDVDARAFQGVVERRIGGEPLAYVTGHREFYGLDFVVSPDVLIPRQETELLVEAVIHQVKSNLTPSRLKVEGWGEGEDFAPQTKAAGYNTPTLTPPHQEGEDKNVTIADIGTGSGAIAVALAHHLPDSTIYATDISAAALVVADVNRRMHDVEDGIHLRQGDLLNTLEGPVDVIVSNPPYLSTTEVTDLPSDVQHEPQIALSAGTDGMDVLRRLIEEAPPYLNPGGLLVVEIDPRRLDAIIDLAREIFDNGETSFARDYAGLPRVVSVAVREPVCTPS